MADTFTLVSPDGDEYTTSDPVEANNLQFGHGYTLSPKKGVPELSRRTPMSTTTKDNASA